jgi:hypothetical protein
MTDQFDSLNQQQQFICACNHESGHILKTYLICKGDPIKLGVIRTVVQLDGSAVTTTPRETLVFEAQMEILAAGEASERLLGTSTLTEEMFLSHSSADRFEAYVRLGAHDQMLTVYWLIRSYWQYFYTFNDYVKRDIESLKPYLEWLQKLSKKLNKDGEFTYNKDKILFEGI